MKKIRILYDHQIWERQKYGGISRYFFEIINQLKRKEQASVCVSVLHTNNFYLKKLNTSKDSQEFNKKSILNQIKSWMRKREFILSMYDFCKKKLNKIHTLKKIKQGNFDILHPTYYDPYFIDKIGNEKKVVITVHDMTHEIFPELFSNSSQTTNNKKQVLLRADKIIAISNKTKEDLVKIFGTKESDITVIYHACSFGELEEKSFPLPKRYILFVGGRMQHKNFIVVAKALALLVKKYNDIHLVCIGGSPFSDVEKSFFVKESIDKHVSQKNVSDGELMYAYKNAICFVFPSLYEGFGMPILESFSSACPVILSNNSCFPEIAKDAALYFDSHSERALFVEIEKILQDDDLRRSLILKGTRRLADFSWEKSANETFEVYKSLYR